MRVFVNGLLTGLTLQAAIGPVFFFIVNLALQRSFYDGLVAVAAVTLVDYFTYYSRFLESENCSKKRKLEKHSGLSVRLFWLFLD